MARRAGFIRDLREKNNDFLLVDSGDFSGAPSKQGIVQGEIMIQAMSAMNYHAAALGERELQMGKAWVDSVVKNSPFPLVAANVSDATTGERVTSTFLIEEIGVHTVGIIGLVMVVGHAQVDTTEFLIEDPVQWAKQLVPELRKQCDYVVILGHLGWGGTFALAQQVPGIDVIVSGHGSHQTREPQRVGTTLLVQAGNQGKNIGVLTVKGTIEDGNYDGDLHELNKSIPEDETVRGIANEYDRRIRQIYAGIDDRNKVSPPVEQVRQKFSGANQCNSCHVDAYEGWLKSTHAHAMESLSEKGKDDDPQCVGCHSTGHKKPGGFIGMTVNPDLANVQCEQCHGAGNLHILYHRSGEETVARLGTIALERAKRYGKVRMATCLDCHTVERDHDFTYREGDRTGIH